jgi:hypothetical protein
MQLQDFSKSIPETKVTNPRLCKFLEAKVAPLNLQGSPLSQRQVLQPQGWMCGCETKLGYQLLESPCLIIMILASLNSAYCHPGRRPDQFNCFHVVARQARRRRLRLGLPAPPCSIFPSAVGAVSSLSCFLVMFAVDVADPTYKTTTIVRLCLMRYVHLTAYPRLLTPRFVKQMDVTVRTLDTISR